MRATTILEAYSIPLGTPVAVPINIERGTKEPMGIFQANLNKSPTKACGRMVSKDMERCRTGALEIKQRAWLFCPVGICHAGCCYPMFASRLPSRIFGDWSRDCSHHARVNGTTEWVRQSLMEHEQSRHGRSRLPAIRCSTSKHLRHRRF